VTPKTPIIHIIDDDDAARDSLAFLLKASGFSTAEYRSASSFLANLPDLTAACVITDVRMPGQSGLELVVELKASHPGVPVIVMTGHGDVPLAVQAMKVGAVDFLEKPYDDVVIVRAVETALVGNADALAVHDEDGARDVKGRLETLTQRERQVLEKLVDGKPNKVTALELGISPRTVEIYRANVMSKMQAASVSDLVRMTILAERHR